MMNHETDALVAEAENMDTAPARLEELVHHRHLRTYIAANPATPPHVLTKLSKIADRAVRRATAQNPNTPLSNLYTLAAEFPEEFLSNPIIPILNMTRPDFIHELPFNSWNCFLRIPGLPKVWLDQINGSSSTYRQGRSKIWRFLQLYTTTQLSSRWHQEVHFWQKEYRQDLQFKPPDSVDEVKRFLLFVSLFPFTSPMLTAQWLLAVPKAGWEVGMALATNVAVGAKTITDLSFEKDTCVLCQVARYRLTSQKALRRLARHSSAEVRQAVASNPHTPLETVLILAADNVVAVRRTAARHPVLSQEDHEILALDAESTVRAALATLPTLAPTLAHDLAHDSSAQVRAALARNQKIAHEILQMLAHDVVPEVRAAAARHPCLAAETMTTLLNDTNATVRAGLSGNTHLPEAHYLQLAQDAAPIVRRYLAANTRIPVTLLEQLAEPENMEVWLGVARHPRATPALLERMALRGDLRVQATVAAHKRTPERVLYTLAQKKERTILHALFANPHCPSEILEQAIQENDFEVWLRLINHPVMVRQRHLPFLKLLLQLQSNETSEQLPNWLRKVVLQYYTALPAPLLEPFATSPYWEERYLVARHPHTEKTLLEKLAQDGIIYVRAAANEMLERRHLH